MGLLKFAAPMNLVLTRQLSTSAPRFRLLRKPHSKMDPDELSTLTGDRLRCGHHGLTPLITEDKYLKAQQQEGRLNELSYEKIRFCKTSEISSHLFDPVHEKFTNIVMMGGRKDLAYRLVHETFYHIKRLQLRKFWKRQQEAAATDKPKSLVDQLNQQEDVIEVDPMSLLKQAVENCKPAVITMSIKRGGATFQVPTPITPKYREWLAMKWLVAAVKDRPKRRTKNFPEVMASELIDAFYERGKVIKKRDDMHKQAEANKAFAHYRWS